MVKVVSIMDRREGGRKWRGATTSPPCLDGEVRVALSAIPIVSHITLYSYLKSTRPIPSFYVRDEAKTHALDGMAEMSITRSSRRDYEKTHRFCQK